jgi:outer membrane lipoprotein-sorting protein
MSRSHRRSAGLTVALSALIAGGARAEPTAEQILLGADAVLAPEDFEADLSMVTHRTDGAPRAFEMHVWKKGLQKVRVRFSAPAEDKNSEVLRIDDNMWNYLPNLGRAIRISPKQEFHGGDFNNTDILRVNLAVDYTATILPGAPPDQYLLELRARNDRISYDLIRYWIHKGDFMPLRQEFFTRSGKHIRTLELSEPKRFGEHTRPSRLVMHNLLVPARRTEMTVKSFEVRSGLDANLFQLATLGR